MAKISIYIPTYNYGNYIEQAINSVIKQTMSDWELIVIDDGSTDNTMEILEQYKSNPQIRIIKQNNKGLNKTNNIAIRLSQGKYIMRLDSDDYLDENALLVLSNVLDSKPEVDLVYPDYYEVDPNGEVMNMVRRKKVGEEVTLLDLPAHGACTMFRKSCIIQIGGYFEDFTRQDGYGIWLKFIQKHNPYNVNVPLFYYRQHPVSITKRMDKLLETRRQMKRKVVSEELEGKMPKVIGIIPVTSHSVYNTGEAFQDFAGKPLLWHTITESIQSKLLDKIIIASDDEKVLEYAARFDNIITIKRPEHLSNSSTKMYEIINYVLDELETQHNYIAEAVCTLYINTPLRKATHIDKAIDTMVIFNVDSVISIEEELALCYHHRKLGLEPIDKSREIRSERNAIYKENSAIYLSKVSVFKNKRLVGDSVGHITMLPQESVKISMAYDFWLAEKIFMEWQNN